MRNLKTQYLVPSHTKPIKDEEDIYDIITKYRDGIQFVHDQTVRFMNQGLTPDEIIGNKLIQLPKHLRKLASREISANGRNWYLTNSLEIQGLIQIKPSES